MISKNGLGYASLLIVLFGLLGIELDISTAEDAITSIITLASLGLMAWNQWSRSDVKSFFFKK